MKKIILVESGQSGEEIKSILKHGYDVIYLYTGMLPINQKNLDFCFKIIKDRKITSFSVLGKYIEMLIEEYEIQTIISTSDFFIPKVSELCEKYKMKSLNKNVAQELTNKLLFREKQVELGYKTPEFFCFNNIKDAEDFLTTHQEQKWVFKPLNSNESVGVKLIKTISELRNAVKTLDKLSRFTSNLIKNDAFILEEFLEGEIYSCEFVKDNKDIKILGVTSREMSSLPYFIETGYEFPVKKIIAHRIIEETQKFIRDFEYDFGPCHIEFIVNNEDIYILEVNPRLIGYPNFWMINKALNIDILDGIILTYITGVFPEISLTVSNNYTICEEVISEKNGYIRELKFLDDWSNNDDVFIIINSFQNDFVRKAESNNDILVRIFVRGDNEMGARNMIKSVKNSLIIRIDD
ncbi:MULTISPECIES: ATP-grasp domain-containing protein [Cytobacillus]|uniref:ATP-grasp domain-containing protein n=1 Tax=Cytobacillus oceanisediminis TaxID=665099 RepID=A0ABX3CJQ8_9BACI|nr:MULTISPECIES: ATP-grasp domain-containing protein [Cytobacillus]OHX39630.1 hypothetical protein BBV17_29495 [Cytobacillus oceanisediminis]